MSVRKLHKVRKFSTGNAKQQILLANAGEASFVENQIFIAIQFVSLINSREVFLKMMSKN